MSSRRLSLGSSWGEVGTWGSQMDQWPWTKRQVTMKADVGNRSWAAEEESFLLFKYTIHVPRQG